MNALLWLVNPCKSTQRKVLQELDEDCELGKAAENHLQSCAFCREYRQDHARIQAALAHRSRIEPSASFAEKTMIAWQDVRHEPEATPAWETPRPRLQPWALGASLAAGVLLLAGISWFFLPSRPGDAVADSGNSGASEMRPIGRAEMFPGSRDVALFGVAFPSRSGRIWNFR